MNTKLFFHGIITQQQFTLLLNVLLVDVFIYKKTKTKIHALSTTLLTIVPQRFING